MSEFDDIQNLGWLSETPSEFRALICERARRVTLQPGQPLFFSGDTADGIAGLMTGGATISLQAPEEGVFICHYLQPGSWFGERALASLLRIAEVRVRRTSSFLFLPTFAIDEIAQTDPKYWKHFVLLSLINSQLVIGSGLDALIRDHSLRCIATILRLAGYRHMANIEQDAPEIDLTQSELAMCCNLSRNAVGTVLQELKSRKFITINRGGITVTNPKQMRALLKKSLENQTSPF